MKKSISIPVLFLVLVGICSSVWAGGGKEDLSGIYIGVIPAADCPGIAVVAIFNAEGEYKITYQYIDRSVEILTYTGSYTYDGKTETITLNSKDLPPYYKVNKKSLTQLDMEGNRITGKLGDLYRLRKVKTP